jgi:hypothetical protein
MREPVVAMDGNTYEKSAIEKWFKSNRTSPLTGDAMDISTLPNMNLKKLIQDLLNEGQCVCEFFILSVIQVFADPLNLMNQIMFCKGGAGLYIRDENSGDALIDISAQKVLVLKCVGPPESEWNMQSFEVSSSH